MSISDKENKIFESITQSVTPSRKAKKTAKKLDKAQKIHRPGMPIVTEKKFFKKNYQKLVVWAERRWIERDLAAGRY